MKRPLQSWLWRVPIEQEVDEGIAFHVEMRTRAMVERGMDPAAAREATRDNAGYHMITPSYFETLDVPMVTTLAALALVLAAIGVFGILAYSVQQRWREFGVRIALDPTPRDFLGMVARSGGRVIGIGVAIGLATAALLGRTIASLLFGVQPLDPVTYAAVAALLGVTAVVATAVPAMRAARVDPWWRFAAKSRALPGA